MVPLPVAQAAENNIYYDAGLTQFEKRFAYELLAGRIEALEMLAERYSTKLVHYLVETGCFFNVV